MSEIPLIWVKRWTQNNYHFVVFCEEQYDDTYKAYAHTDADGNVLPVTYFPMYEVRLSTTGCVRSPVSHRQRP